MKGCASRGPLLVVAGFLQGALEHTGVRVEDIRAVAEPSQLDAIEQGRHRRALHPQPRSDHSNPEIPILSARNAVTEATDLVICDAWKERADGNEVVPQDVEHLPLG